MTPGAASTARSIAAALITLDGIRAVFVGGSRATGTADEGSDTDLYALCSDVPNASARAAVLLPFADGGVVRVQNAWGPEDHLDVDGALHEVVYLALDDLGIDVAYGAGLSPSGYTTAFLHTLGAGVSLEDPGDVLAKVQQRLRTYPEATRDRVLTQVPGELTEYLEQMRKAQDRLDWTGVTNRRAAHQVAWFDLVFAINRRYHPGEKRLLTHLAGLPVQPAGAVERWAQASLAPADDPQLAVALTGLTDDLVALLPPQFRDC